MMARAATSRYAHVLPHLKPLPVQDASRQEKIDAVKATVASQTSTQLAASYATLRDLKAKVESELSAINFQIEAYVQLLCDAQEAGAEGWGAYGMGKNAIRLSSGETIRVLREPAVVVRDKDAYRRWCIANGYGDKLMLWPATTTAIVKERLVNGEVEPDGTEVYSYAKIRLEGAKGGGDGDE